jgi:hypothetical protein
MYKKIIAAAVLVSIIPLLGVSAQGWEKKKDLPLEKISSVSDMKHYDHIVKKEGSLWGVRKPGKATTTPSGISSSSLEKIPNPGEMKKYEGIRQMGNALWGYLKKEYRRMAGKIEDKKKAYRPVEASQVSCVSAAIDAKDKAVMDANSAHAADTNAAISARNTCQKTAIAIASSSEQQKAVEACVKTFHDSAKMAREKNKTAHESAWKSFRESLKACAPVTATGTPEMIIEDGGSGLAE